jgi:hypothetical protein
MWTTRGKADTTMGIMGWGRECQISPQGTSVPYTVRLILRVNKEEEVIKTSRQ